MTTNNSLVFFDHKIKWTIFSPAAHLTRIVNPPTPLLFYWRLILYAYTINIVNVIVQKRSTAQSAPAAAAAEPYNNIMHTKYYTFELPTVSRIKRWDFTMTSFYPVHTNCVPAIFNHYTNFVRIFLSVLYRLRTVNSKFHYRGIKILVFVVLTQLKVM